MVDRLCHCNCSSTVVSPSEGGSRPSAPSPSTGSARSYTTPPIAKEEVVPTLEDVMDRTEEEVMIPEAQGEPLPVPPPQTREANLGPAVSLQTQIRLILQRVNEQRRPYSLVCLWSGQCFDPRDPT